MSHTHPLQLLSTASDVFGWCGLAGQNATWITDRHTALRRTGALGELLTQPDRTRWEVSSLSPSLTFELEDPVRVEWPGYRWFALGAQATWVDDMVDPFEFLAALRSGRHHRHSLDLEPQAQINGGEFNAWKIALLHQLRPGAELVFGNLQGKPAAGLMHRSLLLGVVCGLNRNGADNFVDVDTTQNTWLVSAANRQAGRFREMVLDTADTDTLNPNTDT